MTTATAFAPSALFDTSISDASIKHITDPVSSKKTKPTKAKPAKLKSLKPKMSMEQKQFILSCIKSAFVLAAVAATFRR